MADNTFTPASETPEQPTTARKPRKSATAGDGTEASDPPAKARFSRALDEARAGAQQLGKDAQERADLYREKIASTGNEWASEAKARSGQAREKATDIAVEGKARASEAIAAIGKLVEDNAALVDEKVGSKYGDYARGAAKSMQDAATRLDAKDIGELGEDAKEFVRKSPGLAIGVAAVAGFMLARLFRGSND